MATPRNKIIDPNAVEVFHCMSSCVRQSFLCGTDKATGINYEHRRQWILEMTIYAAQYYAIDVLALAIMHSHTHHNLRQRPDLARRWSKVEVARRWLYLHPHRRDEDGKACDPSVEEVKAITDDKKAVKRYRRRLSSISWFLGEIKQKVARLANKEDGVTGHFWAERFRSIKLEDEGAVLTCNVYIDLNVVRAALATTPEESKYTSAWFRLVALQSRMIGREIETSGRPYDVDADYWLAPIYDRELSKDLARAGIGRRASDKTGIGIRLEQYLELLDWTGRQIRSDKRGAIPENLAPIMKRLALNSKTWMKSFASLETWRKRVIGQPSKMRAAAEKMGKQFLHGVVACRKLYEEAVDDNSAQNTETSNE